MRTPLRPPPGTCLGCLCPVQPRKVGVKPFEAYKVDKRCPGCAKERTRTRDKERHAKVYADPAQRARIRANATARRKHQIYECEVNLAFTHIRRPGQALSKRLKQSVAGHN